MTALLRNHSRDQDSCRDALRLRVRRFWELLGDDSVAFGASVIGWTSSPVTSDLRTARTASSAAAESLSGELNLLSTTGTLIDLIADDAYSWNKFHAFLSGMPLKRFRDENSSLRADQLLWKLTVHLYGNTSRYVDLLYSEALGKIAEFIEMAANATISLDSHKLVRLAESVSIVTSTRSVAGEIRTPFQKMMATVEDMKATLDRIAPCSGTPVQRS